MATGCNGDAAAACSQQQQEPFPVEKATKIFECSVCLMIFHHPVSISCGHTFCAECLAQSVAAMQACPMCRRPVPAADRPVNLVIEAAMELVLPAEALTARAHEASAAPRRASTSFHVPLFVLDTSFFAAPGMHINLRVYEPRYRRLMTMCLEHGTRFGVPVGNVSRGVLIRVDSVTPSGAGDLHMVGFVDGRFENVGLPAVMPDSHGLVGVQVKLVEDDVASPGDEEACRVLANTARATVAARSAALTREEAAWQSRTLGPPPSSPAQLSFWLLVALQPPARETLLFDTSVKSRLNSLMDWIGQGGAV